MAERQARRPPASRAELERLSLPPFVKTSGKKGIHLVVPIKRLYSWKQLHETSGQDRRFAGEAIPRYLHRHDGQSQRQPAIIFVDFHRNARSATAVGVYSAPGREGSAGVHARRLGRPRFNRRSGRI